MCVTFPGKKFTCTHVQGKKKKEDNIEKRERREKRREKERKEKKTPRKPNWIKWKNNGIYYFPGFADTLPYVLN